MDCKEIGSIIRGLEEIVRELDYIHRNVSDIVDRISSIQGLIEEGPRREVVLERAVERVIIRDGQRVFEGLY
jgi:hypothetical protein